MSKFGLEESEYTALCQDIDLVIHCAAFVNLVLPYSALFSANVDGTNNVVSFCLERKLKPIHYIRFVKQSVFYNRIFTSQRIYDGLCTRI